MGSTYLKLTNDVLRRINEVELTESNFMSTRGIQSVVKDAVLDSIREINQQKWVWPFNSFENTQSLVVGQSEYTWPAQFKSVDWNSFQIKADGTLNKQNHHLIVMNRDTWYNNYRDFDDNQGSAGYRIPEYVFRSHFNGFGVSPLPDKAYVLEYKYYKEPLILSAFNDVTEIPNQYDNVILWGALYHLNLFRENENGVAIAKTNFDAGIRNMYNLLLENMQEKVMDTRSNFGGNIIRNGNYKL